jgi:carbamate kinase
VPRTRNRLAVVAFGGNALVRRGEDGTQKQQALHARELAARLVTLVRRGYGLLLVHGNGPQVGQILIQVEEAATKVPPQSLDVCVAQSEGSIGYLLERALRTELAGADLGRQVTSIVTQVRVDPDDRALWRPTKPIGPFYPRFRAQALRRQGRWPMIEDSGRGHRRVVPSPLPVEVLEVDAIRALLARGHLVIAAGGGGIPVMREDGGEWSGVEAVIDKDYTASLLARELGASLLVILTDVDQVFSDYGTPAQRPLARLDLAEARRLLRAGQFPPGSMGPKVEACVGFLGQGGREALITSTRCLERALAGRAGTRLSPDPARPRAAARTGVPRRALPARAPLR